MSAALFVVSGPFPLREQAVRSPRCHPLTLRLLSGSGYVQLRYLTAVHPSTPAEVLAKLARDPQSLIRSGVAHNPHTPPAALTGLALDGEKEVALQVLRNPAALGAAIALLAERWFEDGIAEALMRHPQVELPTLKLIAKRGNVQTRLKLAHHNCSPGLGAILVQDQAWQVRAAVAMWPRLPEQVQSRLRQDSATSVRRALCRSPRLAAATKLRLARDRDPEVQAALAEREDLELEVQMELARSLGVTPRINLVQNPHAIPSVLAYMCRDGMPRVRQLACQRVAEIQKPLEL